MWKCTLTKTIPNLTDLKKQIKKANTHPTFSTQKQRNNSWSQKTKNHG